MFSFDLIQKEKGKEKGWIPCIRDETGNEKRNNSLYLVEPLGLFDTLAEAHTIKEIIGENPLITVSLYRLLIAVLHDIFQGPENYSRWAEIWDKEHFDKEQLEQYFEENKDCFDLFHEEKPFYQTAVLSHKANVEKIRKFYMEGKDAAAWFSHTSIENPLALTPQEAARLILAFQNFDVGATQSGERKGLSKEEKDTIMSAYAAPLNKSAVGIVKGESLFQTLMFNLTNYDHANEKPFAIGRDDKDLPVWRNDEKINPLDDQFVKGYLRLLTWQSRQVKLLPEYDENDEIIVKDVVVMKGHNLAKNEDLHKKEQFVAFKENKGKWESLAFRKERAIWRDSFSLFQNVKEESSRPKILEWVENLQDNEKIAADKVFPLDFFGLGGNQAKPLFWRHERLPMPVAYLKNDNLCEKLKEDLEQAEAIAKRLNGAIYRTSVAYFLHDSHYKIRDWFTPGLSKEKRKKGDLDFEVFKKKPNKKNEDRDEFKVVKGKPVGVIPRFIKTLAPELRYWSRLESHFRWLLLNLAKDFNLWQKEREKWADVLRKTALLAFDEAVFGLGTSPRALRAVSIGRNWLTAEVSIRTKKYLNHQDDDDEIPEQDDSEMEDENDE